MNAHENTPAWALIAANEIDASFGQFGRQQEQRVRDYAAIIAKHSQPYAGAGESELREALEECVAVVRGLCPNYNPFAGHNAQAWRDRCQRAEQMGKAALTPRVASTGSL